MYKKKHDADLDIKHALVGIESILEKHMLNVFKDKIAYETNYSYKHYTL